MKHKVCDLEGALLDAAVVLAEGGPPSVDPGTTFVPYAPSSEWAYGGPIIHREGIAFWRDDDRWLALHPASKGLGGYYEGGGRIDATPYDGMPGPTPLIAAMRAFVASKLGDEVDL